MHAHLHTCIHMHAHTSSLHRAHTRIGTYTHVCVHAHLGSLGQGWGIEQRRIGTCSESQHRVLKSPQPKSWLTEKRAAAGMGSRSEPRRRITLTGGSPLGRITSGAV